MKLFTSYQVSILKNLAALESKAYTTKDLCEILKKNYKELREIDSLTLEKSVGYAIYS